MYLLSRRTQKGYPWELQHETPYLERLFRTPDVKSALQIVMSADFDLSGPQRSYTASVAIIGLTMAADLYGSYGCKSCEEIFLQLSAGF